MAEELRNSIDEAETIKIAVAFLKDGGYHEIDANLEQALNNGKSIDFIVGACPSYHITDPHVLRELKQLEERHPNFNLGFFSKGDFHPKLFIFQKTNTVKVIIGSSNLTSGGTGDNVEANILVEGNAGEQLIKEIMAFFDDEVLPASYTLTGEYIKYYEEIFNTLARSAKRTDRWQMPKLLPKSGSPRYRLYLEDIHPLNERRAAFDKKHRISKYAQGAVYSWNKNNEIDGIVVLWYKSNIEQYFPNENRPYLTVGRYLVVNNLRQGMDIYLVENKYDRELGTKRIDNPKARAYGKLRAVTRVDGDSEIQIFPH